VKSELTNKIESALLSYCADHGHIAVHEVSLHRHGIVDVLSLEVEKPRRKVPIVTWRCYEIKSSVADFNSRAKKSFIGDLNYYVMPVGVYDKVYDKIPAEIGCLAFNGVDIWSVKKATRTKAKLAEMTFVRQLTGSLAREVRKAREVFDTIKRLNQDVQYWKEQYHRVMEENHALKEQ
jgi:hypothetical protein